MERRPRMSILKNHFSRKDDKSPSATSSSTPRDAENNLFRNPTPTRRPVALNMNRNTTPNEPPPAYTPRATNNTTTIATVASSSQTAPILNGDGSQFSFLATFDTIFLIDDSGSMAGGPWRETSQALQTIAPICTQFDTDGIDIHFLHHDDEPHFHNVTLASTVLEIFSSVRPKEDTPTGQRLDGILRPYLRRLKENPDTTKPINIIVITDGVPDDDPESVILSTARTLDRMDARPWQVGIQFFQVGKEEKAGAYLKRLDNDLSKRNDCRDIVDTVPFIDPKDGGLTGEVILKVVLGAVNKRLDRQENKTQAQANVPT